MNLEKDFDQIFHNYSDKVYRLCLGYAAGDIALAQDWQQETFIKVWKHRKSFKGESNISTWIYRIAANTCLGDLRSLKKQLPLKEEALAQLRSDETETQEDQIWQMYQCIDQLTPQNKTMILLELEAVPQAEIGQTMGLKHGAVRTRLNRIRQSLLKCLTNGKR
ncbi:RNA polymerase sigma factor [Gilvibacter sediminis]|uniref:RNA polymerase sigma factor n=1 Tax=Gilvibacter sediminis TaxID=379071 RepID=UPI002350E2FE|nr:RNA polymerase sigma factor [Gilvibacter sediminis]MDC7998944.1 RNA polymerase sigma factor [Gilvibacter sediminis]